MSHISILIFISLLIKTSMSVQDQSLGYFSEATEVKGSGVDNCAGKPFPKAAVS